MIWCRGPLHRQAYLCHQGTSWVVEVRWQVSGRPNFGPMAVREATDVGCHCHTHARCFVLELFGSWSRCCSWASSQQEVFLNLIFFQPIALKTLGLMNSSTVSFFSDLSRRISTVSGEIRESSYQFQRIAITIQRFNSVLFGDSFLPGDDFDF